MADFSKNVPERFPSIGTSSDQKEYVYVDLLPEMHKRGMIDSISYADLHRWAIEEASKAVGLAPVTVVRKAPGRKPKKQRQDGAEAC